MGQGGSSDAGGAANVVDRAGLSEEQYAFLRKALDLSNEGQDVQQAVVELTSFLSIFPSHLRPLVQPLFFQLGRARVGDAAASWPTLVEGISRVAGGGHACGTSWHELLQAWGWRSGDQTQNGGESTADIALCVELAATLCFWCAYPSLRPSAVEVCLEASAALQGSGAAGPDPSALVTALQGLIASGIDRRRNDPASLLEAAAPMLPCTVASCMATVLLGAPAPAARRPFTSRILDDSSAVLLQATDAGLWHCDSWVPLYRDWQDGRSFNGLLKGALHYGGLAAVVIRTERGEILGAVSSCWEEGNGKFGGTPECFLFALRPSLQVMRSSGRAGNHAYLNSKNKHAPRGLGFGGQQGFCRLWLDADFEECHVLQSDATYGDGSLLPNPDGNYQLSFKVSHLEVWGCGGEEAYAAQIAQQERQEKTREQARKVDRAQMIENDFDKEMFFGNTFKATADAREETGVVERKE